MVPDTSAAATRREAVSVTIDAQGTKPTVEIPCKVSANKDAGATSKGQARDTNQANDSVSSSPAGSVVAKFDAEVPSPVTTPGVMSEEKSQQVPFKVLLTQEQAIEIYKVRPIDSTPNTRPTSIEVAEQYGVSPKTVRDVWNRKTWVKVTRPLWAPAELEAYLSESVRRGPGGRQPSPHGEGDEENEDGRSRRPVRESRNNKRQLLSPPEEATVARAAPRKSSAKKLKLPAGAPASSPKRAKTSPSAALPAFGDMSALGQHPSAASAAPKARIAGPRVKKADMAVYMPYDLMVPGQMQQADDMGVNYAAVERQDYSQEHSEEPNSWDVEWQSQTDMLDDGCSPLQEKFDFESSPCNVDYVGPIGGCYSGYGGDVLSNNDLDLAWCK